MPLIRDTDLIRIELPADGEWVDVKPHPSQADYAYVQKAVLRGVQVEVDAKTKTMRQTTDLSADLFIAAEIATMFRAIRAWSFDDAVTLDNVGALDPASAAVITARLNELWEGRSADEKNDSSGNGVTPSLETEPSPQSSAG